MGRIFMIDEIYNKAESPDIKVMGLFYFGNSPKEHTLTYVFEELILPFAFITDNLY